MRDKLKDILNTKISGGAGMLCIVCCMGICLVAGCGGHDKALVIPVEQSTEENKSEHSADKEEAYAEDHAAADSAYQKENTGQGETQEKEAFIYVYVCGAVQNPGMVELPTGSRVSDALEACGGFLENARRDVINLAQKVSDGEMLRFPSLEEDVAEAGAGLMGTQSPGNSGKVNINTADISQLVTLSGIGESRAGDIITYRNNNGNFTKIEDIMKVSGIKESIYNKICDEITVE